LGWRYALLEFSHLSTQFQLIEHSTSQYEKQIVSLQLITILWMCAEAAIAIFAATRAHSVALLGFGADSAIEIASALVVLLRFKRISFLKETITSRITGLLLFVLAAFILGTSLLTFRNPRFRSESSYLGIGVLFAATIVMPWLASQKRRLSARTGSGSLKADAVQSSMCAYLAGIALGGLVLNALFNLPCADPAAALLLLPIVIREGREAMQGKTCADCAC
jgi:divalent metal cation (Fe/Co/Zn/Cd) transporter